jgi:plastocyanin
MKRSTSVLVISAVLVIVAGSSLLGCSKGTSPTNPYGAGSTGGSGASNTPFDSGTLNAPATFVHVFPTAGTVGYHCTFHVSLGMTGTVTVVAGAADSAVVAASGTSFTPSAVSIKPGGYVHWNVTGGMHTVTSN